MKLFLIIAAAGAALLCFWLGAAQGTGTENYLPSRFALMQGSLSISNITDSGGMSHNIQQCILKLDTRTGEVWLLQVAVNGSGDPTVRSAVWAKVQNSGTFYPNGPPMGNN
ncbi:MAG: hypothetical protein J6S54_01090 [Lentisphaeria bacterium]|nr:hypothetical protein [Lentisphaeria bacterium]